MPQKLIAAILLLLTLPAMGLVIVPTFEDGDEEQFVWSDMQKAIVLRAIADWDAVIANDETIHVKFNLAEDRNDAWAALWWATGENPPDISGVDLRPWHPTFTHGVMLNLALPMWFDDTLDTDADADENWADVLTAVRHELGHMLGHRHEVYYDNYGTPEQTDPWMDLIAEDVFDPDGLAIPMWGNSHTVRGLMCPDMGYGRYDVAQTAEMLYKAYGYLRPGEVVEITPAAPTVMTPADPDAGATCTTCPMQRFLPWVAGAAGLLLIASLLRRRKPAA